MEIGRTFEESARKEGGVKMTKMCYAYITILQRHIIIINMYYNK